MSQDRFEFANALRGPAALCVLIGHFLHHAWLLRSLIDGIANVRMPPERIVPTPSYIEFLARIPDFDWGGYGVAIFFLVSGFVIPLSMKKYSSFAFLIGRVFRIWPVYVCGFTVSILSIEMAGQYFGKAFPYSLNEVVIHYIPGIRDLLWSINIDYIVWTLEIEIKFYILCAVIAPLIRKVDMRIFMIPIAIGIFCFSMNSVMENQNLMHRSWKLLYMLMLSGQFIVFMFIGTAFAFCWEQKITTWQSVFISIILLGIFIALIVVGPLHPLQIHPVGSLLALGTFLAFAKFNPKLGSIGRFFSNISYPLYACHAMIGYFIIAVLLQQGFAPSIAISAAFLAGIGIAAVVHYLVEIPAHRFGQKIARRMTDRQIASVSALS